MSSKIEVIPTVPLDWEILKKMMDEKIEILGDIEDFAYQINFRDKSFRILNVESRDDFEVHSPIEYLEEKRSDLIDIDFLARGWENVGFSYHVTPDGEYEDSDFVDLVAMIANATRGIILNIQGIWSWSVGLATPEELVARSTVLR